MTEEEQRLYTQYYYNSVNEFIYFIILYLETFGTASLSNLSKYVKLFKIEVTSLISSFNGNTLEEKLHQMLNTLDCFMFVSNEVKINENVCLKNYLFEELVLSKCIDLVLKGLNNIDDICKHLNFNNVISINKLSLLNVIDKHSHISVKNEKTVTLHHFHGLLGFENFMCNSVISYFHNILCHGKMLSVKEIESHSKFLTFCETRNVLIIFSILNCSDQFICQDGYIWLKKSKKYPKKQPICVEKMEINYFTRSLLIGQIVYRFYGQFLHNWSGEIGKLTENSGDIYCVVDFTDGHQGIFYISFNKAALKVISEMGSLKTYLNVRNVVEFDAEYYSGKKSDRCWRATRVKLLCKNKFEYDEGLYKSLNYETECHRNQCMNCSNMTLCNYFSKVKNLECHEIQVAKKRKVDDKIYSLQSEAVDKDSTSIPKIVNNSSGIISNLPIPDCVLMFGYVHMLMEDKAVAIAKHENKMYNVLFMKDVNPPDKPQTIFIKGQKILVFIPYLEKLEYLHVATLVYGLDSEETKETNESNILPQEFAHKIFLKNTVSNLCCNHCNILKELPFLERLKTDLKFKIEINKTYNFIELCNSTSTQRITSENNETKSNLSPKSESSDRMQDSSTSLNSFNTCSSTDSIENFHSCAIESNSNSEVIVQLQELCNGTSPKRITSEINETNELSPKSKLSDMKQDSLTSLSSFKTCGSTDSIKNLHSYAIESNSNSEVIVQLEELYNGTSPKRITSEINETNSIKNSHSYVIESNASKYSPISLLNKSSPILPIHNEDLPGEIKKNNEFEQIKAFPTMLYENTFLPIDSSQEIILQNKSFRKCLETEKHSNYLSLQSVPFLKGTVKERIMLPYDLESVCNNCTKGFCTTTGKISMISNSFYFITTHISGHTIVLPISKQNIPQNLQENMKCDSCCEISVIPGVPVNLSHVLSARIIT